MTNSISLSRTCSRRDSVMSFIPLDATLNGIVVFQRIRTMMIVLGVRLPASNKPKL
jgi:hypothetical protein